MKKLVKVALVAGCLLLTVGFAQAQTKIGYISFNSLVGQTTEIKSIQAQIETYQKQFVDILQSMNTELQTKAADYESKKATMNDALRTKTESELQDLNKRIQDTQNDAQNKVSVRYQELLKPLVDKLKAGISQVAKEKGCTYVFDTSASQSDQLLLVAPEGDDLMAAVKAKLGITGAAPAATAPAPAATAPAGAKKH